MKKPTRSRVILITGLASFALATAGCPTPISNPPPPEDTGDIATNPPPPEDTGDTGDTGD